jgi:hypothetical protein
MSQTQKLIDIFKRRGYRGIYNYELNSICFRYSARIKELRDAGFQIVTQYIKPGVFKYTLMEQNG